MKKSLIWLLLPFFLASCDLLDGDKISSTDVGGDTNLTSNAVGTKFNGYVKLGSTTVPMTNSAVVTSSSNGVVTLQVTATLPSNKYASMIPNSVKDANGNLNTTFKFKNTSEGILDYTNKDQKPFVIVNYNSNVGDKYVLTKNDGNTITRTVTAKSDVDDFPYGMMLIKTMTVQQDSRIPGVTRIEYKANHKYGLVQVKFYFDDGTSSTIDIM